MKAVIAGILAAGLATPASADFVTNRADWNALGAGKGAYVSGVADQLQLGGGTPGREAFAAGVRTCIAGRALTAEALVAMVEARYALNPSEDAAPQRILTDELYDACLRYLDVERGRLGLQPAPRVQR